MPSSKLISFCKNSPLATQLKRGAVLAIAATALAGCVVDPYPHAYPAPVAVAPAPYGCCYSYPEYPAYYGYAGPSVGIEFGGGYHGGYRGGYGGYRGGGWGGGGGGWHGR